MACERTQVSDDPARILTSEEASFVIDTILEDLKQPNGMVWLPDGRVILAERGDTTGYLSFLSTADPHPTLSRICGLPKIHRRGDGGLLDIRLHPTFPVEPYLFMAYSIMLPDSTTTLVVDRARLGEKCLEGRERLFRAQPAFRSSAHFGCRMALKGQYLFFTMVEKYSERDSAQTLSNHFGKTMRLHLDGSIPEDNPFIDTPGALPEIYSLGHRNPQGLVWHPHSGALWEHEHGPQGGDEINIIEAGANYGWPLITFGEEYGGGVIGEGLTEGPGMRSPIYQYTPSIAPSDMLFYSGKAFPGWQGDLFIGAMAKHHLNRLDVRGEQVNHEERLLEGNEWRIRTVREAPNGHFYLGLDNGLLLRLRPPNP